MFLSSHIYEPLLQYLVYANIASRKDKKRQKHIMSLYTQYTQFAQSGNYNCSNGTDSAYGAGNFGTCEVLGAPNTGVASQQFAGVSFDVILPLVAAVIAVAISIAVVSFKKRKAAKTSV